MVVGGCMLHARDDTVFSSLQYLEQFSGDTKIAKICCYSKGLSANLQLALIFKKTNTYLPLSYLNVSFILKIEQLKGSDKI